MSDHAYAVGPGSHPAVNLPLPNSAEMLPRGSKVTSLKFKGPWLCCLLQEPQVCFGLLLPSLGLSSFYAGDAGWQYVGTQRRAGTGSNGNRFGE